MWLVLFIAVSVCGDITTEDALQPDTEDCSIYTTLDELRTRFGSNEYSLIQGLNARESRKLYHELLPNCIADSPKYSHLSLCEKAQKAFLARKANKQYIRERSNLLVSSFAKIMDYWRHYDVNGASDISLWNRKAQQIGNKQCVIHDANEQSNLLWNDEKCANVCMNVLKSSTKTNEWVDEVNGINTDSKNTKPINTEKNTNQQKHRKVPPIYKKGENHEL